VGRNERFDDANRAVQEHIAWTREALRDGRDRLRKMQAEIDDTNRHIASMSEWIEENERTLQEERDRRSSSS
jgi:septal ring factor EnvC (AmiA/AmiB activator)